MTNAASTLQRMDLLNAPRRVAPLITEIQRFCLQDGPGIRSTVFMKGCPLRCPWCHNPETQSIRREFYFYADRCVRCGRCVAVCPSKSSVLTTGLDRKPILKIDRKTCLACMKCVDACLSGARVEVGKELGLKEVRKELLADLPFYGRSGGGVTLSGGDPLLFSKFSLALAKSLKQEGVHVAMETSCFADWSVIRPLLGYVDLFLVDVKSTDPEKHRSVVGWPLDIILSNIRDLVAAEANVRIHLPIIPGFNDSNEDYLALLGFLAPLSKRIVGVDILPYHVFGAGKYDFLGRDYRYRNAREFSAKSLAPLARALVKIGIADVSIGGLVGMGSERGCKSSEEEVML